MNNPYVALDLTLVSRRDIGRNKKFFASRKKHIYIGIYDTHSERDAGTRNIDSTGGDYRKNRRKTLDSQSTRNVAD